MFKCTSLPFFKHLLCLCAVLYCIPLFAQNSYEFVNQNITDIVYILSVQNGQSIICDETVTGTGNFQYYKGESSDKAALKPRSAGCIISENGQTTQDHFMQNLTSDSPIEEIDVYILSNQ